MKKLLTPFVLCVLATTAFAQSPGAQDPSPYPPPPPAPYPQPMQPAPYVPPPQSYQPQGYMPVQLTRDEAELLQQGEISDNAHIGGALGSLFLGFGIGQAIQGRYGDTGWIFTLGEVGSFTAMIVGVVQTFDNCIATTPVSGGAGRASTCGNNGEALLFGGLIGLMVFRVWEVVDAFSGPPKHNRRVRELKMRLGIPVPMYTHRVVPYMNKSRDGGGTAGVTIRF